MYYLERARLQAAQAVCPVRHRRRLLRHRYLPRSNAIGDAGCSRYPREVTAVVLTLIVALADLGVSVHLQCVGAGAFSHLHRRLCRGAGEHAAPLLAVMLVIGSASPAMQPPAVLSAPALCWRSVRVARGSSPTESGLGSGPHRGSGGQDRFLRGAGLVSMTGTFIDTIIIYR